jgi:hypothetical protein
MPTLRTYLVFICPDWEYSQDYYRVCRFLESAPKFSWEDQKASPSTTHSIRTNNSNTTYAIRFVLQT